MFTFKLAAHLGKTVRELTAQLTSAELIEWQAFNALDPIGGYRHDLNAAMLARISAGNKDSTLLDFIIVDPNPMTDEQRTEYEHEQRKLELEQSAQRMAAMFDKKNQK